MRKILITLPVLLLSMVCLAQTDTISIARRNLKLADLKGGTSQFAVWSKNELTGKVSRIILWERKVDFAEKDGRKTINVAQRRIYEDSAKNTFVFTVSDFATFRTLYDYRTDKTGIQAFDYKENRIIGSDTILKNTKAGFNLSFPVSPYCFELDVETLSMLPINHVGQKFAIDFYHPGGSVLPKYYPVTVVREDNLVSEARDPIKCWVIRLDYDDKNYDLSWISKKKHLFIKLESHSPGATFNKVRLLTNVKTL
jgi:hypothetical protein